MINAIFENTKGIYGYINGEYLDGAGWVPPEGYVPTERPWYIKAVDNDGEVTVIEPYVDAQTGTVVMSLAKALKGGKGVISMDIYLDRIQQITEEAAASGSAAAEIILDERNMVIAHSDRSEVGTNFGEEQGTLGAAILEGLIRSNADHFEFDYGGTHYIVYQAQIQNDWRCLSVRDTTNAYAPLRQILAATVAVVLIIVIVLSAIMHSLNIKAHVV